MGKANLKSLCRKDGQNGCNVVVRDMMGNDMGTLGGAHQWRGKDDLLRCVANHITNQKMQVHFGGYFFFEIRQGEKVCNFLERIPSKYL